MWTREFFNLLNWFWIIESVVIINLNYVDDTRVLRESRYTDKWRFWFHGAGFDWEIIEILFWCEFNICDDEAKEGKKP